jgi:hypothetical protein
MPDTFHLSIGFCHVRRRLLNRHHCVRPGGRNGERYCFLARRRGWFGELGTEARALARSGRSGGHRLSGTRFHLESAYRWSIICGCFYLWVDAGAWLLIQLMKLLKLQITVYGLSLLYIVVSNLRHDSWKTLISHHKLSMQSDMD